MTHSNEMIARLSRLRRRRRQRGAAMVEGLVVIPFFMLIFAGTMLMGSLYARRIQLQTEAREEGWDNAVNQSCPKDIQLADLEIVQSIPLGELAGSPMVALCNEDIGAVKSQPKATVSISGPITFGGEKKISALVFVPCNETPESGDVAYEKAIEFLYYAYQSKGTIPDDEGASTGYNLASLVYGGTTPYNPYGPYAL